MKNDGAAEARLTAPPRIGRAANGFTLLEIVVAVSIAGLALIGLFQAGSTGLFAANTAGRVEEAIERAQSHLAAFGRAGDTFPAEIEGDDGGGYHWRLRATPVRAWQPSQPSQPAAGTAALVLYDVEAEISWRSAGRNRSVVLATRRIRPAAVPQ
jgi:general secretion pathway protein I